MAQGLYEPPAVSTGGPGGNAAPRERAARATHARGSNPSRAVTGSESSSALACTHHIAHLGAPAHALQQTFCTAN